MQRSLTGVLSILDAGEAAQAALNIQKQFSGRAWDSFGPGKVRIVLHAGEADQYAQTYVGPDLNHALKLLETAWGGQILLTVPAVHFIPLPPDARLRDLGPHFLKDLSEPENVYSLQHPDLHHDEFPPLRSLKNYSQNFFPQLSPFFGRQEEIGELTEMLARSPVRQVTLVGPGGFGKTRLAFQTAADVVDRFKDGVYWVALAPLLSARLIVSTIATALKFFFFGTEDPKIQLLAHLKTKECLIVLDNFEHLIEGADLIRDLLRAAPGLKIIVTSREKLGLESETTFEVGGLRFPEEGQEGPLEAFAAVQLFLKSARRVHPGFLLEPGDGPALIRVCRHLEGMPLGLELSASWVSTLTLAQIAEKIESSLDFMATAMPHLPPRHRSLRSVFEYSWILLSDAQKKALMGLSVFRGGFTLGAARAVAGATEPVLRALEGKSLVRPLSGGRYEIHELLKHFAKEKLFDDPALKDQTLKAHSDYFGGLMKKREKDLFGPNQRIVLEGLLQEMENIREGWSQAVEGAREKEMGEYLDSLFTLFETKGWLQEGKEAFQRAADVLLEKYPDPSDLTGASAVLLGKMLSRRGDFEINLGHAPIARKLFEKSLELFQGTSALKQSGFALAGLGLVAETQGDFKKARDYYEQSFKAYFRTGQRTGITLTLNHLGHITLLMGNLHKGLALIRKSLAYSEKDRDEREMAYSYILTGDAFFELGQFEEGRTFFLKSMDTYSRSGDRRGTAWAMRSLGRVAVLGGDNAGARQMYLESQSISQDLGDRRAVAGVTNHLGYVSWSEGKYEEADRLYQEGLKIYQDIGDLRGVIWSLDLLGNLRFAQGNDKEAAVLYQQSHELLMKEGVNPTSEAWHLYHLGTLSAFARHWKEAENLFLKSLEFFDETGDVLGKSATFIHLGDIACQLLEIPKAKKFFKRAARQAREAKLKPQLIDLAVGIARLMKAQGEDAQALSFITLAFVQPICNRQTKDQADAFVRELWAGFSVEELEGARQWAMSVRLEDVIAAWSSSDRAPRRGKKAPPRKIRKPKGKKQKR